MSHLHDALLEGIGQCQPVPIKSSCKLKRFPVMQSGQVPRSSATAFMWILRKKTDSHACTDALVTERTWLSVLVFAYFQDFCLMTTWSYSGIWQTALTELPARTRPLYHQHVNAAACDSFFCGLLQHSYLLTSIHNFSLCEWFSVESKITRQIPIAQPAQRHVWTSGLEQILI